MFTGIVTAMGTIVTAESRGDLRVVIEAPMDPGAIDIGASIACSGVCLTVIAAGGSAGKAEIAFDVSGETIARTVPGMWQAGRRLNLEPALRLGDELGGHLVTGHVDAVGEVMLARDEGASRKIAVRVPHELAPLVAAKGSITIEGVSLTVNDIRDRPDGKCDFAVNIIPHTGAVTTLGALQVGDFVNLEIDVLARYLQRMQSLRG